MAKATDDSFALQRNWALKAAGLGLWQFDSSSQSFKGDDLFYELIGSSGKRELSYRNFLNLVSPSDQALVERVLLTCLRQRQSFRLGFQEKRTQTRLRFWGDAIPQTQGMLLLGAIEREGSKELSRPAGGGDESRQQALFEDIIASTPLAIACLRGNDLVIDLANTVFREKAGKEEPLLGRSFLAVMPEMKHQPVFKALRRANQTRQPFQGQALPVSIVRSGRRYKEYYDVCFLPLTTPAQDSVLCFAQEVTSQVQLKQGLTHASQLLENAVDLAGLGTWMIQVPQQRLSFSRLVSDWIGLQPAVCFQEMGHLVLEPTRLEEAYCRALDPGTGRLEVEFDMLNPQTRQYHTFYARGNTFFSSRGRALKIQGVVEDVTIRRKNLQMLQTRVEERSQQLIAAHQERELMHEKLQETHAHLNRSNESLEQLAFIASHDLQEPLRKIQQFCDLVAKKYHRDYVLDEGYLDRIRQGAQRMSLLMEDLFTFSSISHAAAAKKWVDLNQILDQVEKNLAPTLAQTQAQLSRDELPRVRGDARQLEQLWHHLLANALKFASKDSLGHGQRPRIQVRCQEVESQALPWTATLKSSSRRYYVLSVEDNGAGFDERYSERIFGIFQRLHGKTEFTGSGIGLAICQKVVSNHGGIIVAKSPQGRGAVFEVYLPKPESTV